MPDHNAIYGSEAERYHALVRREDRAGNIPRTLYEIADPADAVIVEIGAGTGRLTGMLASSSRSIFAFDISLHMIRHASTGLANTGSVRFGVADNRALPVRDGVADIVLSGWSVGYLAAERRTGWRTDLHRVLREVERIARPGGVVLLLETLGTGHEIPTPPENLRVYFDLLEKEGFASTSIRTDYSFDSIEEAEELTRFFFGDTLADRVVCENLVVLPECTGIWWKRL